MYLLIRHSEKNLHCLIIM